MERAIRQTKDEVDAMGKAHADLAALYRRQEEQVFDFMNRREAVRKQVRKQTTRGGSVGNFADPAVAFATRSRRQRLRRTGRTSTPSGLMSSRSVTLIEACFGLELTPLRSHRPRPSTKTTLGRSTACTRSRRCCRARSSTRPRPGWTRFSRRLRSTSATTPSTVPCSRRLPGLGTCPGKRSAT